MSYVSSITTNGDVHLIASSLYGICPSSSDEMIKTVICDNFDKLQTGVTITVKFINSNSSPNPMMNINNTGNRNIYRYGTTKPGTDSSTSWEADSVVSFTYDGECWIMNDAVNNDARYITRNEINDTIDSRVNDAIDEAIDDFKKELPNTVDDSINKALDDFKKGIPDLDDLDKAIDDVMEEFKKDINRIEGSLSEEDRDKLDSIEYGANKYSHPTSGVEEGTYGTNSFISVSPEFGETFNVDGFNVDSQGHITSASTHTVKIPDSTATETTAGLMSSEDKKKLDKLPAESNYYVHPTSTVVAATYGTNSGISLSPTFGETFEVNGFVVNNEGHITSASTHTVKIPDSTATGSVAGLLSPNDKNKLDGIETGAQVNTVVGIKGEAEDEYRIGYINITKEDLGLGDLDNVPDNEKNVLSATKLSHPVILGLSGAVSAIDQSFDGSTSVIIPVESIDATKISGVIPIGCIPQGALERLYPVTDDAAKLKLTINDVQNGDVVKVTSTGVMYYVKDETKLGTEAAFEPFVASTAAAVAWTNVTGKPTFASTVALAPSDTPSAGSQDIWARADHVHPLQTTITGNAGSASKLTANAGSTTKPVYFTNGVPTEVGSSLAVSITGSSASCTGNAASATKLDTARNINGVAFDGSKDITITDSTKLSLTGGTMTGALVAQSNANYSTAQVRNITSGNTSPTGGSYGQIYLMYS